MNVLFVCSKNQWRSPTAEKIFAEDYGIRTRSAGTSSSARHRINQRDLAWADIIMVMEKRHKTIIKQQFHPRDYKKIVVLDIADDFQFMDAELIALLQSSVSPYLP